MEMDVLYHTQMHAKSPDSSFQSGVVLGDVETVLRQQGSQHAFDVVIADPPYNIGKDFGATKDSMSLAEYLRWTQSWLTLCFDVLADNGVIYVYGLPEVLARVAAMYPIDEQRWLVWHYTNKAVPSSKFWQRSHESILCLWKSGQRRPTLEVDQIREPYTEAYLTCAGKPRKDSDCRYGRKGKATVYKAHEKGALPRDVIKVPALAGGAGARERWFVCRDCGGEIFPPSARDAHATHNILKHPTQKPMQLTRRLLLSRINGNSGKVLVPFSGSGSECVVAKGLGIAYLGIEISPEYVDFANKWLQQTPAHISLTALPIQHQ